MRPTTSSQRASPMSRFFAPPTNGRSISIVMGVHGRNALDRLVFGSTTEHIIRRAKCPVLTVRER